MNEAILALLDKHIQRCRDAVSQCPKWSPVQAEWSRARDALLNFRDDLVELKCSCGPNEVCSMCPEEGSTQV